MREGKKHTHIKLLSGTEWLASKVLKEVFREVAECRTAGELAGTEMSGIGRLLHVYKF